MRLRLVLVFLAAMLLGGILVNCEGENANDNEEYWPAFKAGNVFQYWVFQTVDGEYTLTSSVDSVVKYQNYKVAFISNTANKQVYIPFGNDYCLVFKGAKAYKAINNLCNDSSKWHLLWDLEMDEGECWSDKYNLTHCVLKTDTLIEDNFKVPYISTGFEEHDKSGWTIEWINKDIGTISYSTYGSPGARKGLMTCGCSMRFMSLTQANKNIGGKVEY